MNPNDRFYSPNDIMRVLSVSRAEANRIMHEFEQAGKLFRHGRLLRIRVSDVGKWVKEQITRNNERVMRERQKIMEMALKARGQ